MSLITDPIPVLRYTRVTVGAPFARHRHARAFAEIKQTQRGVSAPCVVTVDRRHAEEGWRQNFSAAIERKNFVNVKTAAKRDAFHLFHHAAAATRDEVVKLASVALCLSPIDAAAGEQRGVTTHRTDDLRARQLAVHFAAHEGAAGEFENWKHSMIE